MCNLAVHLLFCSFACLHVEVFDTALEAVVRWCAPNGDTDDSTASVAGLPGASM